MKEIIKRKEKCNIVRNSRNNINEGDLLRKCREVGDVKKIRKKKIRRKKEKRERGIERTRNRNKIKLTYNETNCECIAEVVS